MAEKNPIVTIEMNNGDVMKAELYPEVAPNTCLLYTSKQFKFRHLKLQC